MWPPPHLMVIWPHPSATPKTWEFENFIIWPSRQLLYHPIDVYSIASVHIELLKFMLWEFPTTLDKLVDTKVENPVNWRNGPIFQIPISPPYLPLSLLNLVKFCCQNPKTLQTTLIWEKGAFWMKNRLYVLSQQICPRLYYWHKKLKQTFKLLNVIPISITDVAKKLLIFLL